MHNQPQTPYDQAMQGLHRHAAAGLKCPPIRLNQEQAQPLLEQFHETAKFRQWRLLAVAIMANHVHWVVGVEGDPDPTKLLGDFKSYGSRRLTRGWGKPASDTWWTYGGSKRKLPHERAVAAAVRYVARQFGALALWIDPAFQNDDAGRAE